MDSFEYVATLTSVVAGLALTRALSGIAKLTHLRKDIQVSGVHLAWTGSVLLWLVSFWWFTFILSDIELWTVPLFLFVLIYGAFIYFLIALLYPNEYLAGTDLFEYFVENRQWFFGTFIAVGLIDLLDTWIKSLYGLSLPPLGQYAVFMLLWLSLGTVAAITDNHKFHKIFAYSWLLLISVRTVFSFSGI